MNEKSETGARGNTSTLTTNSKNNEQQPGEVKKSISAEPTIPEEENDYSESGKRSNCNDNNAGAWRKQYGNRRKSATDYSSVREGQERRPNHKGKFEQSNQKFANGQQAVTGGQATRDRRHTYGRANSYRNFSTSDKTERPAVRNGMARSLSTSQNNTNNNNHGGGARHAHHHYSTCHDDDAVSGDDGRKRTISGKRRFCSINSMNGESFDYDDDMELDEPFSDSDDDASRYVHQKPCLVIPRGRIRTLSGTVPPNGYSPKWGGPTMCLSCLQFFDLPEDIAKFANHLLEEHHIVIEEVELIVDPKRYIEHWRQRFAKEKIENIFPKIIPDEGDPCYGKTDYYYEMSEHIPEDYSLRQRLAMRRLEEALGCQQREREEISFSMQCIFCRYVARGNRSKIIHHLYMIHHLNLGSPDNLVFVSEYIDHLKDKLQKNECLYCEKTFLDRTVLMDHMRKRNHREVNPKNNYYDKFYIINYLELGKRWLDVLAEDFEDTMPTFIDSDDEEEEESWHEWQEDNMDVDQIRGVCLFCNFNAEKVEKILAHMTEVHSIDVLKFFKNEKLEFYDRMKFLNYFRKLAFNNPNFRMQSAQDCKPIDLPECEEWCTEENLVPVVGNDHLLWMLESYLEEKRIEEKNKTVDNDKKSDNEGGDRLDLFKLKIEGDWDRVTRTFSVFKRQTSVEANLLTRNVEDSIFKAYVEESKQNAVEGVLAEDWPDLSNSVLSDQELFKSLR